MSKFEDLSQDKLDKIQLFVYLIPILGVIPSVWTLSRSSADKKEKQVSRVALKLAIAWGIIYSLLWLGGNQTDSVLSFRLLYFNSLITSAYFLTCIVMLVNLWRGKLPSLPRLFIKDSQNSLESRD